MSRKHFSKLLFAVLALAICTGTMQAATLTSYVGSNAASAITLACDTVLGPTPGTIGIKLVAAGTLSVTVSMPANSPIVLPSPAAASVTSITTATNYVVSAAAGCKGITNNQTVVLTFTPATGTAITVTATLTLTTSGGTALALSPSPVTITCTRSGSTDTAVGSQVVKVTSPANLGTPFTVDTVTNVLPAWLSVTPTTGGTASATPVSFTVAPVAGCGGLPLGSTSFTVHLLNPPAADKLLPVTIQIGGATTPLAASVSPVALSYTKGSNSYVGVATNISASPAAFFTVDAASLPLWLNATPASGTTTSPVPVTFTPTAGAETLALGSYSASVHVKVSGYLDLTVPVTLQVKNAGATLSAAEGTTRTISWTLGSALPTLLITPISTDSPISYTVTTTAGTLSPQISAAQSQGLAYSFGSPISVTFLQTTFGAAVPGTPLSGHVIIHPTASGSDHSLDVDVTITVNVMSPNAAISSISPSSLPTATTGTFTVAILGSGFVVSSDATQKTKVGIVNGGFIVSDSNITANVVNSTSIILTITVPGSSDPYLPFSGAGGSVPLGVCNPQGTTCSTPTGTATLTIGVNPIIQAVTSASSFMQATPPALTAVAPYDILSIFGTNFCISGATGCTGAKSILYGVTDPVTLRYLTSLTPDTTGSLRNLTVTFQTHTGSPTVIATAPLLFATNNQINLLVPDAVRSYIGSTVDIVVSFGYSTGATMLTSSPYSVTVAATNPGVFTVGGAGQGSAAALMGGTYVLVATATPAIVRSTSASDTILLYVTGLGRPDSDGATGTYSATCMAADAYWAAVNTGTSVSPALTSNDGLVLQSAYYPTSLAQPCIKSGSPNVPTVTIGGVTATMAYAGWVSGSVAGLYQMNVTLPASSAAYTDASADSSAVSHTVRQMPIVVTANGKTSQPTGVNLPIKQGLLVTSSGAITGAHSSVWGTTTIATVDGTGPYTYAVVTGTLPTGLTLDTSAGTIDGTPTTAAPATTVVFSVTDSAGVTGTVSVSLTIT